MNKNIGILLLIFIILGSGTAWYLTKGKETQKTTLADWDRKFKIEDTDRIHKIFIANREGEQTTLERKDGYWTYNEKYVALPNAIDNLMRAFREMEMKFKPADSAVPNMVRDLATQGIKVEVYDKSGEALKSFYVGGGTSDERGTHMILEGSNQPYVVYLPTWEGNLRFRFSLTGEQWKDKTVLAYEPEEVQSVTIEYPKQQNNSFRLEKKGSKYEVTPFYNFTPKSNKEVSQGLVEGFLVSLKQVGAEAFETSNPRRDSVVQTIPFSIITVKDVKGKEKTVKLFPIVMETIDYDAQGREVDRTVVERYFAEINQEEFMLVQHRVFEQIFRGYESFFR